MTPLKEIQTASLSPKMNKAAHQHKPTYREGRSSQKQAGMERHHLCRKSFADVVGHLLVVFNQRLSITSPSASDKGQEVLGWL